MNRGQFAISSIYEIAIAGFNSCCVVAGVGCVDGVVCGIVIREGVKKK